MAKAKWLTEEQIGNLIWDRRAEVLTVYDQEVKYFREFKIGRGRVDFAAFSKSESGKPSIHLWELKITATVDSVLQVSKYDKDLTSYLFSLYWDRGSRILNPGECCPSVHTGIIARYIDENAAILCDALDIDLRRITPGNAGGFEIDSVDRQQFPDVPHDLKFLKTIYQFFGGDYASN